MAYDVSGAINNNAAMESWFKTLKAELGDQFASFADAKAELFDYYTVPVSQVDTVGLGKSPREAGRTSQV